MNEQLRDHRLEVLADVLALRGDREGARLTLSELCSRDRERVARLGRSSRPAAVIAAELLVDAASAYR